MKSVISRGAVALVAVTTAIIGVEPTVVSASHTASGNFYYDDLVAGNSTIANPRPGVCYVVGTKALSGTNDTNAVATTYRGRNCSLRGTDVDPGNTAPRSFSSVRFSSP